MKEFLLKKFCTLIFISVLIVPAVVLGQDPHFSQFSNAPLHLNPALTGIFDGTVRVSNSYRSQWSSLGNGYKTLHISIDAPLGRSKWLDNYFGVGLMIYQDKAGMAGYQANIYELSLAYTTAIDPGRTHFISLGFQSGLNQNSFDLSKATWDSQWNGDHWDPTSPSYEAIQLQKRSYLDFNTGAMYYFLPDENNSFNLGASLSHIGRPSVSYYSTTDSPLRTKITVHTSAEISIGANKENWIEPKAMANFQGQQKEIIGGAYFKRKVQINSHYTNYLKEAYFYGGLFYRLKDALVFSARIEYNTWGVGLSYDINMSELSNVAASSNAFEITLSYVGITKRGNRAKNFTAMPKYF
jgi:type IX secretion system PorP/SprF family membrane protein